MKRLNVITAIPQDVQAGSGCYVGTRTLVEGLRGLGVAVRIARPRISLPIFAATRVLFNETLQLCDVQADVTVGIDADGYAINRSSRSVPHVACIKGVLGDAVRFETGLTRASMAFQSKLEAKHARRADLVITVSRYCAERIETLYGVRGAVVVPELIDLNSWRDLFCANPAPPDPGKFIVLSVCRFYPRKRLDLLLQASARLRQAIPQFEVRIVGNGPERGRLRQLWSELRLEKIVHWLGDLSDARLAEEYNRAHIFCLPSVQEGFGIVFLEAMAAGKAIVAARAAAIPEAVRNGILVEPDNADALAEGIGRVYRDRDLRRSLGAAGLRDVESFEMNRVAARFLAEIAKVVPALRAEEREENEYAFGASET